MHADVVRRFYAAFKALDAEGMAACYSDDVVFSDEVFVGLRGEEARDMWRMLCARAKDLTVEVSNIRDEGDDVVLAHWDARYRFGPTQRAVLNRIEARFRFNDAGLIVEHVDRFDFWQWSRQALGVPGLLLGWSPLLKTATRTTAVTGLRSYRAKRPAP